MYEILLGDCLESLSALESESVDTCITSPPYYNLRDYGEDKQIGLESSIGEYIDNMVAVMRQVRRVLKPTGTLWLNIGDSYNGSGGAGGDYNEGGKREGQKKYGRKDEANLKPKDLMMIPARLALALQKDGWYLRQDIIWAKPACMPEPVKDRCSKNHEYIFLLSKERHYYYDSHAIREPNADAGRTDYTAGKRTKNGAAQNGNPDRRDNDLWERSKDFTANGRNKRSVWWITPKPYKGAHFAVFPPDLIEPCVLAGTSAKGCCSECGAPYERQTEGVADKPPSINKKASMTQTGGVGTERLNGSQKRYHTVGWKATCECEADITPCTVLDPFGGSGTTAGVAIKHGRKAILCELNEEYVSLIPKRIESITGFKETEIEWV
jgi:DNA modification methylase